METNELPVLEIGKTYDVKIYDEQPTERPIIRPESLGKTERIVFRGISTDGTRGVMMIDGDPVERLPKYEGRNVVMSFHLWLVESITEVPS